MKKIALEEHFMAPGLEAYWESTMTNVDSAMISRYLGMRSFGQIYGYLFAVFMLANGLGPFVMGSHSTRRILTTRY